MRWSPRVNLNEIKSLYLSCAGGIYDEEKIDSVGIGLFLRCESILEYSWALEGRVTCKRCAGNGVRTFIARKTKMPRELLRCEVCGWQILWRVYLAETDKKSSGQLRAGRARRAFENYYNDYPKCGRANEKMMAIDRLIHEFHWTLKDGECSADRSACVNLLEGNKTQIIELLNNLTYDANTGAEIRRTHEWWRSQKRHPV